MLGPVRRQRSVQIQNQENVNVIKGKNENVTKKRQGLTMRGVLGDLTNNVQSTQDVTLGKIAATAAEFEKKATISKCVKSSASYKHVQSKIDTGLSSGRASAVPLPSARPPLRREESTASHAVRAVARSKMVSALKDISSKENILEAQKKEDKKLLKKTDDGVKVSAPKSQLLAKPSIKRRTRSSASTQSTPLFNELFSSSECSLASEVELPPGIEDIDAGDDHNPLLTSVYIKDIYKYLQNLELKYSIQPDFLRKQEVVTGKMRATLVDWLVEVHRQFDLLLETFQMTVGILDRYLQVVTNVERNRLQLIGVTAMFIASKYEEIYPPELKNFVYITDNAYSINDILKCEREIMKKLNFCLGRPVPLHFLRRFVKAAHGTVTNHHLAKYFVDLALVDYNMAHYRPSQLAAGAMCLSLFLLSKKSELQEVWSPTLSYYSGYNVEDIQQIVYQIATLILNIDKCKQQAVKCRYAETSVAKVSMLPQLKLPIIEVLAKKAEKSK